MEQDPKAGASAIDRMALGADYDRARRCTECLCEPPELEDYLLQTVVEVSPPRWHLAHVS